MFDDKTLEQRQMITAKNARLRSMASQENVRAKLEIIEQLILAVCDKSEQKLSIMEADLYITFNEGEDVEKTPLMEAVANELIKYGYAVTWIKTEPKIVRHLGMMDDDPRRLNFHMNISW